MGPRIREDNGKGGGNDMEGEGRFSWRDGSKGGRVSATERCQSSEKKVDGFPAPRLNGGRGEGVGMGPRIREDNGGQGLDSPLGQE